MKILGYLANKISLQIIFCLTQPQSAGAGELKFLLEILGPNQNFHRSLFWLHLSGKVEIKKKFKK